MGLSVNAFIYAGVDEFDLNFAAGYASRTDVTCVKSGAVPENIEFDFLTDSRVRIDNTGVSAGDEIKFYRTVSKLSLPVDLSEPGNATRDALETNSLHALYVAHEILDGRFAAYTEVTSSVFEIVNSAVTGALQSAGLTVRYVYPLQGTLNADTHYLPCSDHNAEDVKVKVLSAPLVPQEWLFTGENGVVLSVTITPAGTHTVTTYPVDSGKLITVRPVNYQSGSAVFTYVGVLKDYLEFTTDALDFVQIYEDEPCL